MFINQFRKEDSAYTLLKEKMNQASTVMPEGLANTGPKAGSIQLTSTQEVISSTQIFQIIDSIPQAEGTYTLTLRRDPMASAIATGLDFKEHVVNAYLEGFIPFQVDNFWMPLYVISQRKFYQLDQLNYGKSDIWQTSKQAFYFSNGDCEDHAIALADWLIGMGYDARVVLGNYKEAGHAWVLLILENQEYILEATSKSSVGKSPYPLATILPDYHPEFQFNRTSFWTNTGSKFTVSYRGKNWVEKSRFYVDSPN